MSIEHASLVAQCAILGLTYKSITAARDGKVECDALEYYRALGYMGTNIEGMGFSGAVMVHLYHLDEFGQHGAITLSLVKRVLKNRISQYGRWPSIDARAGQVVTRGVAK